MIRTSPKRPAAPRPGRATPLFRNCAHATRAARPWSRRISVTTSDRAGNFYRTLCIEQAGAALEVMVGLDHLHNDYPPGSRLMVRLRGLTLGLQYGVLQAGTRAEPGSGYATGSTYGTLSSGKG